MFGNIKNNNRNVLNLIEYTYKEFLDMTEKTFQDFWTHKMINFNQDKIKFNEIDKVAQNIFLLNNSYQMKTDSEVTSIYALLQLLTNTNELKILYSYINNNEAIHAISYSYGILEMFQSKAKDILDMVYIDEVILNRLKYEEELEKELKKVTAKHLTDEELTKDDYKTIIKNIFSTYIIEQVKFPYSFLTTFRVNEFNNNSLQGFTQLIKRIAKDELETHAVTHKLLFKRLREDKFFNNIIKELEEENFFLDYATKIYNDEKMWIDYLLQNETYYLNKKESELFIKYFINKTLKDIKLPKLFDNIKKPLIVEWFNDYKNLNNVNVSQQEQKSVSYIKGMLKDDLDEKISIFLSKN